ncbi:hypothetical protein HW115_18955 [Verrucomicrobiaceae bacterium N1E253]|uniref:Uncharacterized protein n=1 Tax=Oceaniferula marina TaxID=2748318 RepID=A0A851GRF6_9BACT|nr:hypothetical protein [Oceaniferula marina]NWK57705.1 hypothetical protein [Oceaniferula marina]
MELEVIRSSTGKGVGLLHYRHTANPSWIPIRADYFIFTHDLSLIGKDVKTNGRYFTHRYATSDDGRYLLIEEMEFDGSQESIDQHNSRLIVIDAEKSIEGYVGCIKRRRIFPKSVDGERLIYAKQKFSESGVEHDFERDLSSITEWNKLG